MVVSTAAAAAVLLAGLGLAHQGHAPVARAAPTDIWVSVDESGTSAKTITPILSTASGSIATIISGAPYDVTGTVFTTTYYAVETTSTGTAPATAINTAGAGAFALCHNPDGPVAPFCAPADAQSLYYGTTYYVTWDPTYFPPNATVELRGLFLDVVSGEQTDQTALASSGIPAVRGFHPWTIDSSMPVATGDVSANVSLQIRLLSTVPLAPSRNGTAATSTPSSGPGAWVTGPRVLVVFAPSYSRPNSPAPTGKALYIGLPTIFGFVVLCVVGTWLWNRKTHRIALGSVMGRRRGYGVGKSRAQRLGLKRKGGGAAIRLQDRLSSPSAPGPEYRDEPHARDDDGGYFDHQPAAGRLRRDSDELASLAGTPNEEHFAQQPVRGNVFREEMQRQGRDRGRHMDYDGI